jgi:hypothetical protein
VSQFEIVLAGASQAPGAPELNQDRLRPFMANGEQSSAGMILCDGVGSKPDSALVAEDIAERAAELLARQGARPGIWELDWNLTKMELPRRDGATTLLAVGADESGLVAHLLVGNGVVVEIAPTRLPSGSVRLLWTPIALPQIDWSQGRPGLQSVLPANYGETAGARGYRRVMPGRTHMYLLCSDGVLTEEERLIGRAEDGSQWQPVSRLFAEILSRLAKSWDALIDEAPGKAGAALTELLQQTLNDFATEHGLSDDSSVGAVLVRPGALVEGGTG